MKIGHKIKWIIYKIRLLAAAWIGHAKADRNPGELERLHPSVRR